MYSEQLEAIIDAALADGVLTDKEREVLHKRAAQEGIDADELDIVIDGRLAKIKKQEDWLRPTPPPAEAPTKVGNVMKCPNCGTPYEPGTYKCSECGHVFQNVAALKSSEELAKGIQKILEEPSTLLSTLGLNVNGNSRVKSFILNFPIPTAKADIVDFLLSLSAKKSDQVYGDTYRAKMKEVRAKAKILFAGDPQLEAALAETTGNWWSEMSRTAKLGIGFVLFYVIIMLIGGLISWLSFD